MSRCLGRLTSVAMLGMLALLTQSASRAHAQFTYAPAGTLEDTTQGREGHVDATVWAPGMTFPLSGNAFANTQVFRPGGGWYHEPLRGECNASNYQYPWFDNHCESRGNDGAHRPLLCALGHGHAGQDIRPASCADRTHDIVSGTDGMVTAIGSMSVTVTDAMGRRYQYLHMRRSDVAVRVGQRVTAGTRLATVSNNPGTTIHLHFQMRWSVGGTTSWIPPYSSLVAAYGAGGTYPSATAPRLRSPVESPEPSAFFCHGDWSRRRTDHQCRPVTRQQFGTSFRTAVETPVYAAADGMVIRTVDGAASGSRTGGGLGNQIIVLHAGGRATLYGNLRAGLSRRHGPMRGRARLHRRHRALLRGERRCDRRGELRGATADRSLRRRVLARRVALGARCALELLRAPRRRRLGARLGDLPARGHGRSWPGADPDVDGTQQRHDDVDARRGLRARLRQR